jgi:hypothetical protein
VATAQRLGNYSAPGLIRRIDVPVERGMHDSLRLIGKRLVTVDVAICPDLDRQCRILCSSSDRLSRRLMRRRLMKTLLIVFCLVFAGWPCSAKLISACTLRGIALGATVGDR